jgi:FHA domain/Domain of unknown function (DUF4864)
MVGLRLIPPIGTPIVISQDVSVVGREPGCEIYVNDGSVSRRHARIERRGAAYFVVDEGSANGTFLDSQRVADALLRPGQEVRFGAVPFRVEIAGAPGFETDGTIMGGTPMAAPPPRPAAPPPPPAYPPPPPAAVAPPAYPPAPRPAVPAPAAPPLPPPPPGHAPAVRPPRPVGPAAAPPVAARSGRSIWFWLAVGCGGLLLIGALIAGGIGFVVYKGYRTFQAPTAEVKAHLAEVKAGNLDAAYARLAPAYQSEVSKEEFQAFAGKHATFAQNTDSSFSNIQIQNETATLGGSLKTADGTAEDASFKLVQQGGTWRITDIEVGGERPQDAIPDTGSGVMTVEPLGVQKRREGGTLRVTIRIQVTGFKVRPENGVFAIDLAEDVETVGPDGVVIEGLSRPDVERFAGNTSLATGAFASFTTNLTMDPKSVPGTYTVKLTVRDLVGGGQVTYTAAVDIP